MLVGGHVEKEDGGDPAVDGGVRLDVGFAEHAFNVSCARLDNEVADTDEVEERGTERAEETVGVEFGSRISRLAFVP